MPKTEHKQRETASQKEGAAAPDSKVSANADMLTPEQKQPRVRFAKLALRRERCSWRRVLITDSKYFRLHAMGKSPGNWCTPATRGFVARPKRSVAAHVYMGISYHGVTSLKFVTGTHKQASKYIDPKTKRPYRGVAHQEYNDVLCDHFRSHTNPAYSNAWQKEDDCSHPPDSTRFAHGKQSDVHMISGFSLSAHVGAIVNCQEHEALFAIHKSYN